MHVIAKKSIAVKLDGQRHVIKATNSIQYVPDWVKNHPFFALNADAGNLVVVNPPTSVQGESEPAPSGAGGTEATDDTSTVASTEDTGETTDKTEKSKKTK